MATERSKDATRAANAIIGAIVADAAVMPLHWEYDASAVEAAIEAGGGVEFHSPPLSKFYSYEVGQSTPYGDEVKSLLDSVASKGSYDNTHFTEAFAAFVRGYEGRLNHSAKTFIENVDAGKPVGETGADNSDAHNMFKAAIIAARYAGHPDFKTKLEAAIRVQQNNDLAVSTGLAAGAILEQVILGSSVEEALEWAKTKGNIAAFMIYMRLVPTINAAKRTEHTDIVHILGPSCAMPGCFLGAVHGSAKYDSYEDAIRATIRAGGDGAGRAAFIGALFGAAGGVPEEWVSKCGSWIDAVKTQAGVVGAATE